MKKIYVLLIVIAGFILMPTMTFACGKHKHSCNKEIASNNKADKCCGDENTSSKKHDGCGGKCGHSKCGCTAGCSSSITFYAAIEIKRNSFAIIQGNQKFHHSETNLSSGFNSLWLIPKIS